jgi:hypothetical protein
VDGGGYLSYYSYGFCIAGRGGAGVNVSAGIQLGFYRAARMLLVAGQTTTLI